MRHLLLLAILFIIGCNSTPSDEVIANNEMVVYVAKETTYVNSKGKFEYYIRDGTDLGWKLITDDEFQVGDVLIITVKPSENKN